MARALIFDSGVGGLTVAQEIRKLLPGLIQNYVADDAFRPYGNKTDAQLQTRLPGLLSVLCDMTNPDIVVIACNTASTTALPYIRAVVNTPVVGVVPAIKPAAKLTKSGVIGVLGTPATIRRRYVDRLIAEFAADKTVCLHGSTDLVQWAEDKLASRALDIDKIRADIRPLFSQTGGDRIDQIVLACTHFPLLKDELDAAVPHKVGWVDSGAAIARRVRALLIEAGYDEEALTSPLKSRDDNMAFLIGPDASEDRRGAFARFGFSSVIGLEP